MSFTFSRADRRFTGIIALVHLLFFLLAMCYKRIYMGDSFEYIYEALNIKQEFFFYSGNPALPIKAEYMTQRQPLYPVLLLGVYLFAVNNWLVLVLQNLLSIFNIYYCRKVFTMLGYQQKYDWLLLLLIAAYPSQFINANTIAPDILLQTCTVLYFGLFVSWWQARQMRYALWMSLALVAGLLAKPVLYPFAFVHLLFMCAIAVYHRAIGRGRVIAALLPVCAVLAYDYSNYTRTGKFHFSSNQSFNAIYYYHGYFSHTAGADSAARFLQNERKTIAAIPVYKDRYDYANRRGAELLKYHFVSYMVWHLQNSARIFIEPGKAEIDLFTGRLTYGRLYGGEQTGFYSTLKREGWGGVPAYIGRNPSLPLALIVLLFNIVRFIGLVLFFRSREVHWAVRLFIFTLICYFAIAAGPIANTRYFLPVSLIAIAAAVTGYRRILEKKALS